MTPQIKTRSIQSSLELRDNRRLCFYAAIFSSPASVYDFGEDNKERLTFEETVAPGAFTESLAGSDEVEANIDHDSQRTFAKRSTGDLLLQQDGHGLFASCYLPEDDLGQAVMTGVQDASLVGASFRFVSTVERWRDKTHCELVAVKLKDVCLTGKPAYPATKGEVHLRNQSKVAQLMAQFAYQKMKLKRLDTHINGGA